jgi:septum site-determining protein MinC
VQTKQYSVKVFETVITDEDEFIAFFDKNSIFFKNHLISISGIVNEKITNYLDDKSLRYIINAELLRSKNVKDFDTSALVEQKEQNPQQSADKVQDNLKVIDKLVRSGQELKIEGDLLLLNRVNSGGSLNVDGNLIVTQIVDGSVRCNGNFMMLKASPKANIIFHDVEVDNSYLKERLNRVELKNNEIVITPVLKETSWE